MPAVSVIIPTYNRCRLLGRAVQSVLSQTFRDFELIIIDDASTDGTDNLIKSFDDSRIVYSPHEKRAGSNASRNIGIRIALGKYISFLDSDDEWLPEKLEKQISVFAGGNEKLGVVYTGYSDENIDRDEPVIPHCRGDIFTDLLVKNVVGSTTTPLVKCACFETAGLFDETMPASQDWDMWIRIARHFEFDFVPEILARYYFQFDSISRDIKAVEKAHRLIGEKYRSYSDELPKDLIVEHYYYEGRYFFWRRDLPESCRYFIKTVRLRPSMLFTILRNYGKKLINRIKTAL